MTTQDDEYSNNKPDANNKPAPGDLQETGMAEENESYAGSSAANYDPDHTPDLNGLYEKPSGENTRATVPVEGSCG